MGFGPLSNVANGSEFQDCSSAEENDEFSSANEHGNGVGGTVKSVSSDGETTCVSLLDLFALGRIRPFRGVLTDEKFRDNRSLSRNGLSRV